MFSLDSLWRGRALAPERFDLAARRCGERRVNPGAAPFRDKGNRLYFAVRSFAAGQTGHVLQYAFVDGSGNIILSAFARTPRLMAVTASPLLDTFAAEPLDPQTLEDLINRVCAGASLVAFGRVLQGGLLPIGTTQAVGDIDCAWRRFLRIARQRKLSLEASAPMTLDDALGLAGLSAPQSDDAVMRALALRDLWAWMDSVERPTS